jgi:putative transposase
VRALFKCMPRLPRFVLHGFPHHDRGNDQQKVFHSRRDYELYCRWLFKRAAEYERKMLAYCLTPNHIHVFCVPSEPAG